MKIKVYGSVKIQHNANRRYFEEIIEARNWFIAEKIMHKKLKDLYGDKIEGITTEFEEKWTK